MFGSNLLGQIIVGAGAVVMLFLAWKAYKSWSLTAKMPTSPIGRVYNQLAEVKGTTMEGDVPLKSPITQEPCIYYSVKIERYQSSGRSGRWVTEHQESSTEPIYIEDSTGRARILPQAATAEFEKDFQQQSGGLGGDEFPAHIKSYLQRAGVDEKGFLGLRPRLRCEEIFLKPGEQLYVLGWGSKKDDVVEFSARDSEPFIISDFSEQKLRSKYLKELAMYLLLGGFMSAVAIAWLTGYMD